MHRPFGVRFRFVSWGGKCVLSVWKEGREKPLFLVRVVVVLGALVRNRVGTDCIGDAGGCGNREAESGGCAESATA